MKMSKNNSAVALLIACFVALGNADAFAQEAEAGDTNTSATRPADISQNQSDVSTNGMSTNSVASDQTSPTIRKGPVVVFFRTVELSTNESAEAVVVIGGSAIVHGRVRDAVVAIGGSVRADSEIGDAAVAVLGNVIAGSGAHIHDAAVAVGGSITLEDNALVDGDAVAIGGGVSVAKKATVKGIVQPVEFNIPGLPKFEGVQNWITYCLMEMRPLAPQVRFVWIIAGVFALVYFLVAVAFPNSVQVCVSEMTTRPATTFLVGLLTKVLIPIIALVLAATGIGLLVIPFLLAAVFFAVIMGKVALLEGLGGAFGRPFGLQLASQSLIAFLIGLVVLTLLYMVPILGFVVYCIFAIWGLGIGTTAAFSRMRRERRPQPAQPPMNLAHSMPASSAYAAATTQTISGTGEQTQGSSPSAVLAAPPVQPALPAALSYPRAGFWERMGAAFLDCALLGLTIALVGPFVFLVALAYFAGMWTWKGTTIGGIVLKLQVVRYDGVSLNFLVALVRALAAAFSVVVLFLGFFWIGWDSEKQGWHDKIAGTVVVRLPRSVPLVCL